jgi:hypothetical protein
VSAVAKPWFYSAVKPEQMAMDTETTFGKLKLLVCPDDFFEPANYGRSEAERMLGWMLDHGAPIVWFFNLRYDTDIVLRFLYEALEIEKDEKALVLWEEEHKMKTGDYTIKQIGAKSFVISDESKRSMTCFDVSPFVTEDEIHVTLDHAAEVLLGKHKLHEELNISRKRLGCEAGYYEAHREDIIKYAKMDAQLTLELGDYLLNTAHEEMGVWPTKWSSAASLSKCWLELHHPSLMAPTKHDKLVRAAFRPSFRGGVFRTPVLGRISNVEEADINSAYASAVLALVSTEGLGFWEGMLDRPSESAVYGSYYVDISYDGKLPWRISDLGVSLNRKNNPQVHVLYPETDADIPSTLYCATLSELRYFDEAGIKYRIIWASELRGKARGLAVPDFPQLMKRIKDLKVEMKKMAHDGKGETSEYVKLKMTRELSKRIANSLYGSLAESKHGETRITNWPLAASITAACRIIIWREWRAVEAGGGVVISVNTDSLRYVPGSYVIPKSDVLGGFSSKFEKHTVTHYQSGVAMIEHPQDCDCPPEYVPDVSPDWSPARVARHQKATSRIVRVNVAGKNPQFAFDGETDAEIVRRIRHPPAPHERHGLELHQPVCRCGRCDRVSLRKRGMPILTAPDLLTATGPSIETVITRPIHFGEAMIQGLVEQVGIIPNDEADVPEDDPRRKNFSLLSNLQSGVFHDESQLTFENLNAHGVSSGPIQMTALLTRDWVKRAVERRRALEAGAGK